MKQKVEDPLNVLERDMSKLEGNLERTGKIMNSMQKTVDKIKFHGGKPADNKQHENVLGRTSLDKQVESLVRKPKVQGGDVDNGCVFSATASGKSANVKVNFSFLSFFFFRLSTFLFCQGLKKVSSGYVGLVAFLAGQVTFETQLPNGQKNMLICCLHKACF